MERRENSRDSSDSWFPRFCRCLGIVRAEYPRMAPLSSCLVNSRGMVMRRTLEELPQKTSVNTSSGRMER